MLNHQCRSNINPNRTVRSAAKGKAIQERYANLKDKFDIAIVEDLVTDDLTQALQGMKINPSQSSHFLTTGSIM